MGSPWPCAAVADTSGVHNFHPFPSSVIRTHHQDPHPLFGVAFVSVDQDSGFFDNNEDLNGVSSNSSKSRPIIFSPQPVQDSDCNNFSNFLNPHNSHAGETAVPDTTKRYLASSTSNSANSALQLSPTNSQTDEPARKRLRFRGNCVLSLREIPTWNIYYHDQRRHLVKFSDKNKACPRDSVLNKRVSLSFYKNVLVKLDVDVVVCCTTESFSKEAGVAKLLHEEAGRDLGETCNQLPKCGVGNVVATDGFMLPARFIFHVNGPDIHTLPNSYEEILHRSYENCLNLLVQRQLRTIAIPCISTGPRKSVPKNIAAGIALSTVRRFLEQHKEKIDRVVFCLQNKKDIDIYLRLMQIYFPVE